MRLKILKLEEWSIKELQDYLNMDDKELNEEKYNHAGLLSLAQELRNTIMGKPQFKLINEG